jgi:hypothetical protein
MPLVKVNSISPCQLIDSDFLVSRIEEYLNPRVPPPKPETPGPSPVLNEQFIEQITKVVIKAVRSELSDNNRFMLAFDQGKNPSRRKVDPRLFFLENPWMQSLYNDADISTKIKLLEKIDNFYNVEELEEDPLAGDKFQEYRAGGTSPKLRREVGSEKSVDDEKCYTPPKHTPVHAEKENYSDSESSFSSQTEDDWDSDLDFDTDDEGDSNIHGEIKILRSKTRTREAYEKIRNQFEERPFLIKTGTLAEVVQTYLTNRPFLSDENAGSKQPRKSTVLSCRRTIRRSHKGNEEQMSKTQFARSWHSWPEHVCPLCKIYVVESKGKVYMFGFKSAQATRDEWLAHSHDNDTFLVRSGYVPPDIVDEWCVFLKSNPEASLHELINFTEKRNMKSSVDKPYYLPSTSIFITKQGLHQNEKIRGLYRSLTDSQKSGLKIKPFLESIKKFECSKKMLTKEVKKWQDAYSEVDVDSHPEKIHEAKQIDKCLFLSPAVYTSDENGFVKEFCSVFTSARMIKNLSKSSSLSIDCTFSLVYGSLVMCVVATLPRRGTGHPVALAMIQSESANSVRMVLEKIFKAFTSLEGKDPEICEVVIDGSQPLRNAVIKVLGKTVKIAPCFFHVMQVAKKNKGVLPSAVIWREIKTDLGIMASSRTREEWKQLKALFVQKWENESGSAEFLRRFKNYLNEENFRSHWGAYNNNTTNNKVERFNLELKKHFNRSRRPTCISRLHCQLDTNGMWGFLSKYGREEYYGQVTEAGKRSAIELMKNSASIVFNGKYLFIDNQGPYDIKTAEHFDQVINGDICIEPNQESLRLFVRSNIVRSLPEIATLKQHLIIVDLGSAVEDSDYRMLNCSCKKFSTEWICEHVICTAYRLNILEINVREITFKRPCTSGQEFNRYGKVKKLPRLG